MEELLPPVDYYKQAKLFIVADTIEEYLDYCRARKLHPYLTFYCEDEKRANYDVAHNLKQGLLAEKVVLARIN